MEADKYSHRNKTKRFSVDFSAGKGIENSESLNDFIEKLNADISRSSSTTLSPIEKKPIGATLPVPEENENDQKLKIDLNVDNQNEISKNINNDIIEQPRQTSSDTAFNFALEKEENKKTQPRKKENENNIQKLKLKQKLCKTVSEQVIINNKLLEMSGDKSSLKIDALDEKPLAAQLQARKVEKMEHEVKPSLKTKNIELQNLKTFDKKVPFKIPTQILNNTNNCDAKKQSNVKEIKKVTLPQLGKIKQCNVDIAKKSNILNHVTNSDLLKCDANHTEDKECERNLKLKKALPKARQKYTKEMYDVQSKRETSASKNEKIEKTSSKKKSTITKNKQSITKSKSNDIDGNNNKISTRKSNIENKCEEKEVAAAEQNTTIIKKRRSINWKMVDVGKVDFDDEITEMNGWSPNEETDSEYSSEENSSDESDSDDESDGRIF